MSDIPLTETCAILKIEACPECRIERDDLCWIKEYRAILSYMRAKDVKEFYLDMLKLRVYPGEEHVVSYWIDAVVNAYFPNHKETIDKIRILL